MLSVLLGNLGSSPHKIPKGMPSKFFPQTSILTTSPGNHHKPSIFRNRSGRTRSPSEWIHVESMANNGASICCCVWVCALGRMQGLFYSEIPKNNTIKIWNNTTRLQRTKSKLSTSRGTKLMVLWNVNQWQRGTLGKNFPIRCPHDFVDRTIFIRSGSPTTLATRQSAKNQMNFSKKQTKTMVFLISVALAA